MNLQYVQNISDDGKEAVMMLCEPIGNTYNEMGEVTSYGVNGYMFANEMKWLKEVKMVDKITVEINTIGGSVVEGLTICNAIATHGATTRIIGLAASMGFCCARAGAKCEALDYATLMCHPTQGADEKTSGIMLDALKNLVQGKTKMNGDTTNEIFSKETFFSNSSKADYTLAQALEMGIIDEIVDTGKKIKGMTNKKRLDVSALATIYNQALTPKTMSKVPALLGLKNEANDDAIAEAVETLKKENETLKAELEASKAKVTEYESKEAEAAQAAEEKKGAEAVALVENAVKTGVVKAEEKDKYVNLAKVDLESVKNMFEMAAKSKTAVQIFNKAEADKKVAAERESWTIRDWEKKDPKGLAVIKNNTPEIYQAMYDAHYKKNKK